MFVLKVLDGGKIVLECVMLCAVVVYCFVFSCAYVEVLRGLTEGLSTALPVTRVILRC